MLFSLLDPIFNDNFLKKCNYTDTVIPLDLFHPILFHFAPVFLFYIDSFGIEFRASHHVRFIKLFKNVKSLIRIIMRAMHIMFFNDAPDVSTGDDSNEITINGNEMKIFTMKTANICVFILFFHTMYSISYTNYLFKRFLAHFFYVRINRFVDCERKSNE